MLIELDDSESLPMPLSLPKPLSAGGILVGSAGRATGRIEAPEGGAGGFAAAGGVAAACGFGATVGFGDLVALEAGLLERLTAERLASSLPARVAVEERRVAVGLRVPDDAFARLVCDRLASVLPARFAVIRLVDEVAFFAAGRLAVERLAVGLLAADFFVVDFFFAAISPPSGGDA